MARKPRIQFPGASYHIMCRGDHSEPIFLCDEDRELFLKTLSQTCERTGWIVYAYVLMDNHYHLLIKTPEPNLVPGMKWFQGTYTQRFNASHELCGHLFQGRYKAILVDQNDPEHFRAVADYIHLNPARAHMILEKDKLTDYQWSSLPAYSKKTLRPEWLDCVSLLAAYDRKDDFGGRSYYRERINHRAKKREHEDPIENKQSLDEETWCLGNNEFQKEMRNRLGSVLADKNRESYSGKAKRDHAEAGAEKMISTTLKTLSLSDTDLHSLNCSDVRKEVIAWLIHKKTSVPVQWIADRLQMGHRVNVSRGVSKIEKSEDVEIKELKLKMLQCTD